METKHKPATPLPWKKSLGMPCRHPYYLIRTDEETHAMRSVAKVDIAARGGSDIDAAYIAHAANAYPKLVEALRAIVSPDEDGFTILSSGNRDARRITALLRELGESK